MDAFSRWLKTLLQDFSLSDPRAGRDPEPPAIRQRLTRYTST